MSLEFSFTCPLPSGVHARPASALEAVTRGFASDVTIQNQRTGGSANAKSVLGIVSLDIRGSDRCRMTVSGDDEAEAIGRLQRFIEVEFPRCDEPLAVAEVERGAVRLPPALKEARPEFLAGTPAAPGIGLGRAVWIEGVAGADSIPRVGATSAPAEKRLLDSALADLARRYDARVSAIGTGVEAGILRAHRSVARDPEFKARLLGALDEPGRTAAGAIAEAQRHFTTMLSATGSAILRERALDIRDVCVELMAQIYGESARSGDVRLAGDAVCLADALTPARFLAIDRTYLKGLILTQGGITSHTVILARSFGIPALVGVDGLDGAALDGREVLVDADLGILLINLTGGVRRYYEMERRRIEGRARRTRRLAERPAATTAGTRIDIAANVASADEVASAVSAGASGIGVFRTEMLFAARDQPPSEDEQFEHYRRALTNAGTRAVIIRTLDVGGDKPLPFLRVPREDNPFLGCRAVRLYPAFETLLRSQARALIRASAFGRLEVMVPMVTTLEEARWTRQLIADEQRRLADAGVAHDPSMPVGAMIEVPSAAFMLDHLCRDLDFFSIGTNDLLQYFCAADRTNPGVAHLLDPLSPAFLRILKKIVDDVHAHGRRISMCGEMAGQVRVLPLLAGLGLDELSMAAPRIPEVKAALADVSAGACRALLEEALACPTAGDVARLLDGFAADRPTALIDPDLVVMDAACRTKAEAIKALVDQLYVAGRTDRPRDVEEAVWQREAVYSTGFGHGFAIPHCKSDAVRANSLAVLKLSAPVDWGSLDEKPVSVVLLLTIRESEQATAHMKALAALARRLMHEEFREQLAGAHDAGSLCLALAAAIDPNAIS